MLLSSVIIILREFLEAALLVSVLLALSKQLNMSSGWILWAGVMGLSGAIVYATNLAYISELFEGVGQEVTNSMLQMGIFGLLLIFIVLFVRQYYRPVNTTRNIAIIMGVMVTFAIIHEGSEILIYLYNFTHVAEHFIPVLTGAIFGSSIGISTGIIFYYLLCNVMPGRSIFIGILVFILLVAGMASQAALLLIQADWLPAQLPLWDSSSFVSEESVIGQLLYAIIGYEATPTPIQAGIYFGAIITAVLLLSITNWHYSRDE